MKRISLLFVAAVLMMATSCKNNKKKDKMNDTMQDSTEMSDQADTASMAQNITLTKFTGQPEMSDVSLKMTEPSKSKVKAGKVHFKFDVKNFKFGEQTEGAGENGLAHSAKGQHIHLIIDDKPYTAHYKAEFDQDMSEGDHVVVAFPARSYHMAIKNENAVAVKKITVGNPSKDQMMDVDLKAPHLIYSRPKGTYSGKDTKKVLLDFFLLNTKLGADGNKVKATINGQEFTIDAWAPYVMEGLPMGENTIKLELVDNDGQVIKGPFNSVERTFTLEK